MKTRTRLLTIRKIEAARRLRGLAPQMPGSEPLLDEPMEMSTERIDVATGELVDYVRPVRSKRR